MVVEGLASKKVIGKGTFKVDFPKAIAEFESSMQKFPVKKILYQIIFRGKGPEFDSYRQFAPDDDSNLIDWKASLRANAMLARKYIEERDLHVYFLFDVGSSMLFGSGSKLKAEYAAEMVVALSHLIVSSGDRVGLILFNQGVVKFLRAASSRNQLAIMAKYLSDASLYGGGVSFETAFDFALGSVTSPYTVFILVSDFLHVDSLAKEKLKLIANRYEALALMIRDPLDEELPDTSFQFAIQDPFSSRQMVLDPALAREQYKNEVLKKKQFVRTLFKESHVDILELLTREHFTIFLSRFLRQRVKGGLRL